MNVVNPQWASVDVQNAIISQLKTAGVRVIRVPLTPSDKDIDFAKRAFAQGIQIDAIIKLQYPQDAPTRPYQPEKFPHMWSGSPLSFADPELSKAQFQKLIEKLEASGITLAGLELGNEINQAAFNADFPLPGEGITFGLNDLYHDPEAKQIAKGFLQYLKVLAELKDVRDHSKLNQRTPIISAGLAGGGPEGHSPQKKKDSVSINATLQFLRTHGLDSLVDAYGVHTYPWNGGTPENRKMSLEKYVIAECGHVNSRTGKPCWITEWGIVNDNISCPVDDTGRSPIVGEIMDDFREFAKQGRLTAALYFSWNMDPASKRSDVYRCGNLTESGKLALLP
ncbi:MAG: hypothetical protein P4L10_03510 [Acidobacteriaceae bacterium]|nr:hypothetical protein [Acidobacteriaceae bacterium]